MAEGMTIAEAEGGILVYEVYDPRIARWVGGGFFDMNTLTYHKFATKESEMQRKCNGKPLGGFGIQENVFEDVCARECRDIVVHFRPYGTMYATQVETWERFGLMASYSGLQRFLGILTLAATKRIEEAKAHKTPPLTAAEVRELEQHGKQMSIEPDVIPSWFGALIVKEVQDGTE